ncbi:MAG: branched-chain-amino-acid transaminase [Vicinamibacterales bacterium]
MTPLTYVDGRFVPEHEAAISVLDHGLLYGDGVFEGIRAYDGRVFRLDAHIDRLFASAHALRLSLPLSREDISAAVLETCRRNAIRDGYVRLVVTRGVGDLGLSPRSCHRPSLIVIARPRVALYESASTGIRLCTSSLRRPAVDALSPAVKSLNYVNNVLARMEAHDRGCDEALLLDADGYVAEASADNIFAVDDQGLVTPPASSALRGITREAVVELAREMGIPCAERRMTLYDVWTAREVFVCGTAAEIVPVVSIDNRSIGSAEVGDVTDRIRGAYAALVRSSGTPIAHAAAPEGTRLEEAV